MSELIQSQTVRRDVRWSLLATVSSLALATACLPAQAADDADRPMVWIELGAQFERVQGSEDAFLPPFLLTEPRPAFEDISPATTQRPPRYSLGGEGKLTFQPHGSDWSLTAAIRYGRSNSDKHLHQQTTAYRISGVNLDGSQEVPVHETRWGDTVSAHRSSHLIADFMAGRDVGLGLWRGSSTASVDFGVRFAQFTSARKATINEVPDDYFHRSPLPPSPFFPNFHKYKTLLHHHSFYGHSSVTSSFSGIGPTLSLNGSQSLSGNANDGEITLDWGVNAAVLFGRQKVRGSHKTSGAYFTNQATPFGWSPKSQYNTGKPIARSRSVVVPNVGGFAGLSARYHAAKLSFGYRADFFFGAMDVGLDARDAATRGFHGPFATVGIGF